MIEYPTEFGKYKPIRLLIWIYFFLVIFEGTLRKWVFPGLANELLLVRDPFLILIYILALSQGIFPFNGYVSTLSVIGVFAVILGLTTGSRNPLVTAYGFDAMFFHLPLIFIFPKVMSRNDVMRIGWCILVLAVPMAILMVLQFRAPFNAPINCGAGGSIGSQMHGAMGKVRPPGLFTFITGAAQFLALTTAFLIIGFWKRGLYPRLLLVIAGFALVIATVVSTSRLALGGIGLVFLMVGVVVALDRKSANNIVRLLMPIGMIFVVATNLDIFKEGREVFEARLEDAGDKGAGLTGTASNWTTRVFGDFVGGIEAVGEAPLLGAGLGVGTNVGARTLSGEMGFLLAEGEWARVVLEIGPLLAIPYLIIRALICLYLLRASFESARAGNALPMLLFGNCVLLVLSGQFSQSNTVGFAVLGAGLCLASTNVPEDSTEGGRGEILDRVLRRPRRGRSPYAEALHQKTQLPN